MKLCMIKNKFKKLKLKKIAKPHEAHHPKDSSDIKKQLENIYIENATLILASPLFFQKTRDNLIYTHIAWFSTKAAI